MLSARRSLLLPLATALTTLAIPSASSARLLETRTAVQEVASRDRTGVHRELSLGSYWRNLDPGAEVASGSRKFLQTDPAGFIDGPNLYTAFGNDPVNMGDPSGLWSRDVAAEMVARYGTEAEPVYRGVGLAGMRLQQSQPVLPGYLGFMEQSVMMGLAVGRTWLSEVPLAAVNVLNPLHGALVETHRSTEAMRLNDPEAFGYHFANALLGYTQTVLLAYGGAKGTTGAYSAARSYLRSWNFTGIVDAAAEQAFAAFAREIGGGCASGGAGSSIYVGAGVVEPVSAVSRTIGLGLDEDLFLHWGKAITYKEGGWQRAGLTKVDWGRASVDNYYFRQSFLEALDNAGRFTPDRPRSSDTQGHLHTRGDSPILEWHHLRSTMSQVIPDGRVSDELAKWRGLTPSSAPTAQR